MPAGLTPEQIAELKAELWPKLHAAFTDHRPAFQRQVLTEYINDLPDDETTDPRDN
jgi:hypothetical protein